MASIFRRGRSFFLRRGGPLGQGLEEQAMGGLKIWQSPGVLRPRDLGPFNRPGSLSTQYVDPDLGRPPGTSPFADEHAPPYYVADPEFTTPGSFEGRTEPTLSIAEVSPRGENPREALASEADVRNNYLQFELMAAFFEQQVPRRLSRDLDDILDNFGKRCVEIAREMIDEQEGISQGIWPPLAEVTLERKLTELILYETGDLESSIHYEVDRGWKTVTLVSDSEYMYFSELGTAREPARPLLAPSMAMAAQELPAEIGNAIDVAFRPSGSRFGLPTRGEAYTAPFPRFAEMYEMTREAIETGDPIPTRLPFRIPSGEVGRHTIIQEKMPALNRGTPPPKRGIH